MKSVEQMKVEFDIDLDRVKGFMDKDPHLPFYTVPYSLPLLRPLKIGLPSRKNGVSVSLMPTSPQSPPE